MIRIVGKLIGGPLDGQFVSTEKDVLVITGMMNMRTPEIDNGDGTYGDSEGKLVDSYIKDESKARAFVEQEQGAFNFMFDGHGVESYCEFTYNDGTSS